MPGFDRTGPLGQGSKTGRKLGKCSTENETLTDEFPGRGLGRRLGRRFRLGGNWNFPGQGKGFGRRRGGN